MNDREENNVSFMELNKDIIRLSEDRPKNFPEIGRKLKIMRDREVFQKKGFENFREYIQSLDGTSAEAEYSTVDDIISVYEAFSDLLSHKKERSVLRNIGWSKLEIISRYIYRRVKGIFLYDRIDACFNIPDPLVLNVTDLIHKGMNESKKALKDGLSEEKNEPRGPEVMNYVVPPFFTILQLWDQEGFRLICPKCEEVAVECYGFKISFCRQKKDPEVWEVSHEAYSEKGEEKLIEEVTLSHIVTGELSYDRLKARDDIQCFVRGMADRLVHDFIFKCTNCESRQYMVQIDQIKSIFKRN